MNNRRDNHFEEEAQEDRELESEKELHSEDQKIKGDDLEDYEEKDYQNISQLDKYDSRELDENQYSEIGWREKRMADEEIDERHQRGFHRRNVPFIKDDDRDSYNNRYSQQEFKAEKHIAYYEEDIDQINYERFLHLEDIRGKLPEWIKDLKAQKFIKVSFYKFLMKFSQDDVDYQERVKKMCSENR